MGHLGSLNFWILKLFVLYRFVGFCWGGLGLMKFWNGLKVIFFGVCVDLLVSCVAPGASLLAVAVAC